jgi:hypothetical protein
MKRGALRPSKQKRANKVAKSVRDVENEADNNKLENVKPPVK